MSASPPYPQLDPHMTVVWEGDGRYTPTCAACPYTGKRRDTHAEAVAACRSHQGAAAHRKAKAKLAVKRS